MLLSGQGLDGYSLLYQYPCELTMQADAAPQQADAEPMNVDAKQAAAQKAEAKAEKEAGNAAYKKRQFDEAIQHYNRALELDDGDISFLTNRCMASYNSRLCSSPCCGL